MCVFCVCVFVCLCVCVFVCDAGDVINRINSNECKIGIDLCY